MVRLVRLVRLETTQLPFLLFKITKHRPELASPEKLARLLQFQSSKNFPFFLKHSSTHDSLHKNIFQSVFTVAGQVFAQVTTVRRYNPSGNTEYPQTYSAEPAYESPSAAATRRAAALSKVQGTTSRIITSKGLSPAQYSTDGPAPAEYSMEPNPATTFTVNGANVERNVKKELVRSETSCLHPLRSCITSSLPFIAKTPRWTRRPPSMV